MRANKFLVPLPASASNSGPTPDILWWKANEGAGTTLADASSGATNGGTLTGGWGTGPNTNACIDLNGSTDFAVTTNNYTWGTNVCSICFWLNVDIWANPVVLVENDLFGRGDNDSFEIWADGTDIHIGMAGTTGYLESKVARPSAGTWRHFVFVIDSRTATGVVKAYINGSLQSLTNENSTKTGTSNFAIDKIWFGMYGNSLFLDGKMDDMRIYGSEITQTDVTNIYNFGAQ